MIDAESEDSVPPDVLTREQLHEFDIGDFLDNRNDIERRTVNQSFSEMNKQITELLNLVLVLTEKISFTNREGNDLNTVSIGHETRSHTWNKYYFSKSLVRILPWDPWLPRCSKNLARSCQDSQDASKRVNPG